MSVAWLPCLVLCVSFVQDGSLEIVNPRGTYGRLGAVRPKSGVIPGDTAHFTFEIKNLKLDDTGKASYSIALEFRDSAGKILYEQKPHNATAQNFLGGNTVPCSASVDVPFDAKPGEVTWKVTVKDRTTKQSAVMQGKGIILPADFGIVQVGLFADAEASVPTSAVGVVGDAVYLRFSAVGFGRDKETKQPNLNMSMRILDEKGKSTMAKPITGKVQTGVNPQERFVPLQFGVTLNRPGRFTIELTAEDVTTGKRSQISYGIRVLPLD